MSNSSTGHLANKSDIDTLLGSFLNYAGIGFVSDIWTQVYRLNFASLQ